MKRDILGILEAAYAESADPDAWLQGALDAIHPHLDRGAGVFAHRFEHRRDSFWRGTVRGAGTDERLLESLNGLSGWLERLPARTAVSFARRFYPQEPTVVWVSELAGGPIAKYVDPYLDTLPAEARRPVLPVGDSLGVIAADPTGHGCIFFTMDPRSVRLPARTTAAWKRVAAHLVTGYRLARQRHAAAQAVLSPAGKVLHLEAEVSRHDVEPLKEAARAIDLARGKLRRTDPDRALALWRGLVAGRWSLVDHFDHDGRRYVVAKRNPPEVRPWHELTEREAVVVAFVAQGQTHKIIAYQLGLSPSAVGESLRRACRKLGAGSRLDLVAAYRTEQGERTEP